MSVGKSYAKSFWIVNLLAECIEIDIVIAYALHLCEMELNLFTSHIVEVDKLCAFFRILTLEAFCECICCVDRSKARNISFNCLTANLNAISCRNSALRRCRDNIVDDTTLNKCEGIFLSILVNLRNNNSIYAIILDNSCSTNC